jgi:hypothetical protein
MLEDPSECPSRSPKEGVQSATVMFGKYNTTLGCRVNPVITIIEEERGWEDERGREGEERKRTREDKRRKREELRGWGKREEARGEGREEARGRGKRGREPRGREKEIGEEERDILCRG